MSLILNKTHKRTKQTRLCDIESLTKEKKNEKNKLFTDEFEFTSAVVVAAAIFAVE